MDIINVLDAQSANMIAAGEVVERPAAALKELMENAIDAGATAISAEIKDGGITLIRVSDNGCGISRGDLPKALLRHATSKIKTGADIDGVLTLGFRGEALAAIAAVSRMSIISRQEGDSFGNILTSDENGVSVEDVGCPVGTTVLVEGLFYNTPARRKFLKRDATEAAACRAVAEKLAVANPGIAIRFTSDSEEKFSTTGGGDLKSAITEALGSAFAKGLIAVSGNAEDVFVSGYVSTPDAAKGKSTAQSTFVNGRYVVSKTVQAALKEAFKSYLPHDRYPASVLFLTVPPRFVDVNVHPAKTEIKFANERTVYEAVYYSVRTALQRTDAFTGDGEDILITGGDIKPALEKKAAYKAPMYSYEPKPETPPMKQSAALFKAADYEPVFESDILPDINIPSPKEVVSAPSAQVLSAPTLSETFAQVEIEKAPTHRYVGEAFDAYIIAETKEALYIIDKHAAHERILYEQLRKSTTAESQSLLVPVIAELSEEDVQLLLQNKEYLYSLGFDIDAFGDNSVAVRTLPAALNGKTEIVPLLEQFAASLQAGGALPFEERCDRALFTMACKAAVKAGVHSEAHDNAWIIDRLFEDGSIKYCPHGRPVAKVFAKREADKWFDR